MWSEVEHLHFDLPGVRVITSSSFRSELEVALDQATIGQVVDAALKQGPVRDLAIEDAPLDEVIRALYATARAGSVPS